MKMIKLNCPACSAPVNRQSNECEYCGIEFNTIVDGKVVKRLKDFGLKGKTFFIIFMFGIVGIYILGWFYENTNYWLDETAVFIWAGILPLWILVMTSIWSNKWGAILLGFGVSILIFGLHLLITAIFENWYLNDDDFGIAGMFATVPLITWLTGRAIHSMIRKSLNKSI